MNDKIAALRQAIVLITQSLVSYDIKVTQQGFQAYVQTDKNGNILSLNLPNLPDNADDELISATHGYLDHEVAHIFFTDFKLIAKELKKRPDIQMIFNTLEDARIEREMCKKYRGSAVNLDNVGNFFLKNITTPLYQALCATNASEEDMFSVLGVPLLRAMSGQRTFEVFMKDKMQHIQGLYEKIKDLEPQAKALASSGEAIELSKIITDRLQMDFSHDSSHNHEQKEQTSQQKVSKAKKAKDDDGNGDAKNDAEQSQDSNDGAKDDGATKKQSGKKDGGKGGKKGNGSLEQNDEEVREISPSDDGDMPVLDLKNANNFDEALEVIMGEKAKMAAKNSKYNVFTRDYDTVEVLTPSAMYRPAMLTTLIEKTEAMTGPISKELERVMTARSQAVWENGLKKGRLHSSSLARLCHGDTRVFRKKQENNTKDVAVSLVVDCSGSMSGRKLHTASATAFALATVLDKLKIATEVICFTTGSSPTKVDELTRRVQNNTGVRFSRYEPIYMPILKQFNDSMTSTDVKKRFAWLPHANFLNSNIDGESVEIAFRRLQTRKEKGKVMIVLSDGYPAASGNIGELSRHLKTVIEGIEKTKDTRIIGIGIDSDAVQDYYSKYTIISDIQELPTKVIREVKALLIH